MGGEGADAVRGPAARGAGRGDDPVHAAGRRRADVADHAAAARRAAAGPRVRARFVGPGRGRRARRRARPLARAVDRVVSRAAEEAAAERRRALAVPADRRIRIPLQLPHGCSRRIRWGHRLALRSEVRLAERLRHAARPPGRVLPLRPYGINHPAARHYEPGTNVLVTTWKTPSGWVVVRDALTMGPTNGDDTITPHTRPPADNDADHLLVRTVECLDGSVEVEIVCEPIFDYGREPAEWTLADGGRQSADAKGAGLAVPPAVGSGARDRRQSRARAAHARRRARRRSARCRGPRHSRRPTTSKMPRRALRPPSCSGATGSTGRAFRTTCGATPSSARHSRSRA